MTPARVPAALLAALFALASLTGCISIPTAGPIKPVLGEAEVCQSCVNVEVAPPTPGADPQQVVDGYLRANSNYQPNYAVARQFLTAEAADRWRPEVGMRIYRAKDPKGSGDSVRLTFTLTGALAEDRTYSPSNKKLRVDFGLTRENGQWRISRPPEGLLVEQYAFERSYTGYSRYFFGNGLTLVPERIYLPNLRNKDSVAAALMTGLLAGPSDWLEPAAGSAIPKGTALVGDSVTINDEGIAQVALTEDVLTLDPPARSQLGAQVVYTLQQVTVVRGVQITVGQQKFRIPEADPGTGVLTTDAFPESIKPEPLVSDQSYALQDGRVHAVRTPDQMATIEPIKGPLGEEEAGADSLAVSVNGTEVATATDERTILRRADIGTGEVVTLATDLEEMLRPQFTRYGEVWTIARQQGLQQIFLFAGDRAVEVDDTVLNGRYIKAFRISPDGSRMALVWRTDAKTDQVGLARIIRGNRIIVDEWRPLDVQQEGLTQVAQITDVAWLDANELLLLGATDEDAPLVPVRVTVDASKVVAGTGEPGWNAEQLTVLPRQQSVVVVGTNRRSWRNDGRRWLRYVDDVTDIAYAG